jgi:argininosuccinate synthase
MHSPRGPIALAFSGGLDTSYCVPRLADAAKAHGVMAGRDFFGKLVLRVP